MFIGFILTMAENAASPAPADSGARTLSRVNSVGSGPVLVAVKMRGYLANSLRELTVPVEANQR